MCIDVQVELTDREFEKMLVEEEKQKEGKRTKKPRRDHRGPKSRILNRRNDRRIKADESGDEVSYVGVVVISVESHVNNVMSLLRCHHCLSVVG